MSAALCGGTSGFHPYQAEEARAAQPGGLLLGTQGPRR